MTQMKNGTIVHEVFRTARLCHPPFVFPCHPGVCPRKSTLWIIPYPIVMPQQWIDEVRGRLHIAVIGL